MILFSFADTSMGKVLVASSPRGLCAILLGDDVDALQDDLESRFPTAELRRADAEMHDLTRGVADLIETPGKRLDVPLDLGGTDFQREVWNALREIPAGQTATYSEIADRIGRPRSVRAVAAACGANALAVAVPCHRVLRRDGGLSGYRWGVERKRLLLEREAR